MTAICRNYLCRRRHDAKYRCTDPAVLALPQEPGESRSLHRHVTQDRHVTQTIDRHVTICPECDRLRAKIIELEAALSDKRRSDSARAKAYRAKRKSV